MPGKESALCAAVSLRAVVRPWLVWVSHWPRATGFRRGSCHSFPCCDLPPPPTRVPSSPGQLQPLGKHSTPHRAGPWPTASQLPTSQANTCFSFSSGECEVSPRGKNLCLGCNTSPGFLYQRLLASLQKVFQWVQTSALPGPASLLSLYSQ